MKLSCPAFLVVLMSSLQIFAAAVGSERPNVVLVYADDLRWDALGVVQQEQGSAARFPWLRTPRLDKFAAESVRFRESFVVTSLCSPGRAAVLTSRYGHHTGIIGNGSPLPVEIPTVAKQLKQAGYTTAYCGKWHMDGQRERPNFDFVASFVGQGRYFDCPVLRNGAETPTKGWVDDVCTDYAIEFVANQPKDRPFFLWLGFKSPHGPRGGENLPDRVRNLYEGAESRPTPNSGLNAIYNGGPSADLPAAKSQSSRGHQDYMRHVTAIDDCFGRLLDALEHSGHAARTLVIFTSDNGYYLGEHNLGDKRSAYDESLRVPLLVRLPGHKPVGTRCDDMVLNLDYSPTILDYAGAPALPTAQGRSLRPLLEGKAPADWRQVFFYEYFKEANFAAPTVLAVRTTNQKLITYPGHPEWAEVFDLKADPFETRNLIDNANLTKSLQRQLDEQMLATGFRWPEGFNAAGDAPAGKSAPGRVKKPKKQAGAGVR